MVVPEEREERRKDKNDHQYQLLWRLHAQSTPEKHKPVSYTQMNTSHSMTIRDNVVLDTG